MKRKDFKRIASGNRVIASFMHNGLEFNLSDETMLEFNYHSDFGSMFNVLNKLSEYVDVECELNFPISLPDDLSDLYDGVVGAIQGIMLSDMYWDDLEDVDEKNCGGNCNGCSCK